MKYMITGGGTGLGLEMAEWFGADSYSRHNGYDTAANTCVSEIVTWLNLNH